ncbi:MAG: hypothetical protein RRY40_00210 [Oscillospiraceae bacterium]
METSALIEDSSAGITMDESGDEGTSTEAPSGTLSTAGISEGSAEGTISSEEEDDSEAEAEAESEAEAEAEALSLGFVDSDFLFPQAVIANIIRHATARAAILTVLIFLILKVLVSFNYIVFTTRK